MEKSKGYLCAAVSLGLTALLGLATPGPAQSAGDLYSTDNIVGKMRYVPAGVFTQGSPTNEPGRNPDENQFTHFLTQNIAVMETAVTKQMWADLKLAQSSLPPDPSNPSLYSPIDNPVHSMTWYLAVLFANLLSIENGFTPCYYKDSRFTVKVDVTNYKSGEFFCSFEANGYRLPTEGEREYFARAGTTGAFSINESNYSDSTCSVCTAGALPSLESVSWFCANNSNYGTKTAGSLKANPWNLKDVHGNVMEWCWDYYGPYPTSNATDFRGPSWGEMRLLRGGAWPYDARTARSANRFGRVPYFPFDGSIGFRLVRTIGPPAPSSVTVIAPAGGETWRSGAVQPLRWTATDDINFVNIEYSANSGGNWTSITAGVPNSGQWDWSVPSVNSTSCLVRISNAANPAVFDLCAAAFSIVASPPPALHLNRPEVDFYAASGQTTVPSQWLMIGNAGGGTLNWTATPSAGWITATPSSGTGSRLVKIDAHPAGLSAGTYVETLTISDPQAAGSPRTVWVVLDISTGAVEPYFTVEVYKHQVLGDLLFMRFMDFDGDGDDDIVTSDFCGSAWYPHPWGNGRVYAWRNDGQGNFTDATTEVFIGLNIVVGGAKLLVADFNRDGRDDLFVGDSAYDTPPFGGGGALLFIQTQNGRLANESASRLPADYVGGNGGVAGDFDGDGSPDIYLPGHGLLLNDGSGYFDLDKTGLPPVALPAPGNTAFRGHSATSIDVEKDGDLDLFLNTAGPLPRDARDVVLVNDGSGHFTEAPADVLPPRLFAPPSETISSLGADFDADGFQDLVLATQGQGVGAAYQLLLNNGDGTFRDASANIPSGPMNWDFRLGDINNDGWMDFVGSTVLLNKGNAQFAVLANEIVPFYDASGGGGFHTGDIDNDGDTDLFIFEGYSPNRRSETTFQISRNIRPYVTATPLPYPAAPVLVSPADGVTLGTNAPTLTWNTVPTAVSYEVEVATDAGFSFLIFAKSNICPAFCPVTGLDNNTTYYWRVRAHNTRGAGPWSAVRTFFVSPITIVSPNGGENWPGGTAHDITWTAKGMTGTVTIDLHKGGAFNSTIGQADVGDGIYSWAVPSGLAEGTDYTIKIYQGGRFDFSDASFSSFQARTISGHVIAYGQPVVEAVLGGLPGNPETDASGFYSVSVPYGWSGTVTPFRFTGGYLFEPESVTYSKVNTSQTSDYEAYKGIPAQERAALIAFYQAAGGDTWADHSGWKTPPLEADGFAAHGSEGTWHYVNVVNHRVLDLAIGDQTLTGNLPPEIGNLRNLRVLVLYGLSGPIPATLANLTNLINLGLVGYPAGQLTGGIPSFIGALSKLQALSLAQNKFTGPIPPEIGSLVNLAGLALNSNMLSGPVPAAIKNLTSLGAGSLDIGSNALYADDPSVKTFLDAKDPGWDDDQTVAPTNVRAVATGGTAVIVSWTPIKFTEFDGGYRVHFSQASGGPYTFFGQTVSKSVSSLQVTGLTPGTKYYFVVQTRSDPHDPPMQINTLDSEYSAEVSATTPGTGTTVDDLVVDFGPVGLWLWSAGVWSSITGVNPDGMIAADVDGDNKEEIVVDFGAVGLWIWDDGAWTQLSGVNADGMIAADTDGEGKKEVVGDFGTIGLWLWNEGTWTQLSGINADGMIRANCDADLPDEIVVDFGTVGLWVWDSGSWTQLSGVNADGMIAARLNADADDELVLDFGPVGLWVWDSGVWTQVSGVNADGLTAGDLDGDSEAEVAADFGSLGVWVWDSGVWEQVSGVNAESLFAANVTASASSELIVDFGSLGIWMRDGGAWSQISTGNPEGMISANLDADVEHELVVDFGPLGINVWNGGVWSQLSASDPESMVMRKK